MAVPIDHAARTPANRPPRWAVLLAAALLIAFVAARCYVNSALWLDEALSVSIARLPLSQLPAALRLDGSPPLYYALLHGWIAVWGDAATTVRLLSAVFSLAALPVAFAVGVRLRDRSTGWCAVLLLAANPFAVHYATETRMYALLVLEVLLLVLALQRARQHPGWRRLAPVPVAAAALLYTHYWSLFLLAAVAVGLAGNSLRGAAAPTFRRLTAALAASALLFAPWLPSFTEQIRHTGTPWAQPPAADAYLLTVREWAGGNTANGALLAFVLLALMITGVLGRTTRERDGRGALTLALPADRAGRLLLGTAAGALLLGLGSAMLMHSGYAYRYSSVALAPALLLAALGLAAVPGRARTVVAVLVLLTGGAGVLRGQLHSPRTQAGQVAAMLRADLRPGDLVLYCPDQLGPAVSRLLGPAVDQIVYPSAAAPARVDWRDYQARNAAARPAAFAALATGRTTGRLFLVWQGGYRTFGSQCQQLGADLSRTRGPVTHLLQPDPHFAENHHLDRFPAAGR